MNTGFKKNKKNIILRKIFFKLMNKDFLGKLWKVWENKESESVSESNYHATKFFTENLLAIEMEITERFTNKSARLWLSILELTKILI